MEPIRLQSGAATAQIDLHGARVTAEFPVGDRRVNPFYVHGWAETEDTLLGNLKGDFFCLPFGSFTEQGDCYAHGQTSHKVWQGRQTAPDTAVCTLQPQRSAIASVTRTVRLEEQALSFVNEASAAADAELTVGSHPIFRLPQEAGRAKLLLPRCACVRTYPQQTDEHSRLLPNARCDSPERVPLRDGGAWDCTRVPLPENVEELLFLGGVEEGRVTLENKDEGYAVTVEWDPRDYASLMLWFSNRGRTFAPWNGTNLCLGVEPITGPFDLGNAAPDTDRLLAGEGIPVRTPFRKGETRAFRHRISIRPL